MFVADEDEIAPVLLVHVLDLLLRVAPQLVDLRTCLAQLVLEPQHELDAREVETELGLNLAGVELVLRLEDELRKAQAHIDRLQRERKQEVESVHKHYRRDLVLYRDDLLPARR